MLCCAQKFVTYDMLTFYFLLPCTTHTRRFISNSKWNDEQQEDEANIKTRRRSWNWIGDNVRLNSEEERVFNEEHGKEGGDDGEEESSEDEEELFTAKEQV